MEKKIKPTPEQKKLQAEILKKSKAEEKKKTFKYRIKKNKDLKICWFCWMWTDWIVLKRLEVEEFKNHPNFEEINEICNPCAEWIKDWVVMYCNGYNCYSKEKCNNVVIFNLDKIRKWFWDNSIEAGSEFEVWWCVGCSPDKKIHLTKESLEESYKNFNWKK